MEGGAACEPKLLLRRCSPLLPELELTPPVRADGPAARRACSAAKAEVPRDDDAGAGMRGGVSIIPNGDAALGAPNGVCVHGAGC